ncbi:hypothetical protein BKA69DRAFT_1125279 [Paraphysoderma sedebokerense]|nr:hypothetical protein BKA69DRAFT_1125279 [Paraphysoderma sedebokerense]
MTFSYSSRTQKENGFGKISNSPLFDNLNSNDVYNDSVDRDKSISFLNNSNHSTIKSTRLRQPLAENNFKMPTLRNETSFRRSTLRSNAGPSNISDLIDFSPSPTTPTKNRRVAQRNQSSLASRPDTSTSLHHHAGGNDEPVPLSQISHISHVEPPPSQPISQSSTVARLSSALRNLSPRWHRTMSPVQYSRSLLSNMWSGRKVNEPNHRSQTRDNIQNEAPAPPFRLQSNQSVQPSPTPRRRPRTRVEQLRREFEPAREEESEYETDEEQLQRDQERERDDQGEDDLWPNSFPLNTLNLRSRTVPRTPSSRAWRGNRPIPVVRSSPTKDVWSPSSDNFVFSIPFIGWIAQVTTALLYVLLGFLKCGVDIVLMGFYLVFWVVSTSTSQTTSFCVNGFKDLWATCVVSPYVRIKRMVGYGRPDVSRRINRARYGSRLLNAGWFTKLSDRPIFSNGVSFKPLWVSLIVLLLGAGVFTVFVLRSIQTPQPLDLSPQIPPSTLSPVMISKSNPSESSYDLSQKQNESQLVPIVEQADLEQNPAQVVEQPTLDIKQAENPKFSEHENTVESENDVSANEVVVETKVDDSKLGANQVSDEDFESRLHSSWSKFISQNSDQLRILLQSDTATTSPQTDAITTLIDMRFEELKATILKEVESNIGTKFESNGLISKPLMEKLIAETISTYAADTVAKPDFALAAAGARVLPSVTTETYALRTKGKSTWSIFGFGGGEDVFISGKPPVTALMGDTTVGQCWPIPTGQDGVLGIKLARNIIIKEITIDHLDERIAIDIRSAPKEISVYALYGNLTGVESFTSIKTIDPESTAIKKVAEMEAFKVVLNSFEYNPDEGPIQTFKVRKGAEDWVAANPVRNVAVVIKSNWGHGSFTCLYRVRVHGEVYLAKD